MAALALGLLTEAPSIIGAVGDAVHLVERLFKGGKGTDKKTAAVTLAGDVLSVYAKAAPVAGLTGAGTPEFDQALENLVQAVVDFYNATGLFVHAQKPAPAAATPPRF